MGGDEHTWELSLAEPTDLAHLGTRNASFFVRRALFEKRATRHVWRLHTDEAFGMDELYKIHEPVLASNVLPLPGESGTSDLKSTRAGRV